MYVLDSGVALDTADFGIEEAFHNLEFLRTSAVEEYRVLTRVA